MDDYRRKISKREDVTHGDFERSIFYYNLGKIYKFNAFLMAINAISCKIIDVPHTKH